MTKKRIILGIETSCDETAAAVYDSEHGMRSNKLFSQIDLHRAYGGVVPEIASRSHMEKISIIVQEALDTAEISLADIDTIAVTTTPGLSGSLLVGMCFAKGIAYAQQKKLIGINHLEGHAFSSSIEHDVPFPHICLTASGGHTALYIMRGFGDYELIGETLDDAAGEAFDKIAKLINLPYPGGPVIEKLAREAQFVDFFKYPRTKNIDLNFSFSGLKTAVLYDLIARNAYDMATKQFTQPDNHTLQKEVASSLLVCIADVFEETLARAYARFPEIKALSFVGGVACNKYIKERLTNFSQKRNISFYAPSPQYCTDNAAMIAFVGNYKAKQGIYSDLDLDIFEQAT